jgi:hypothetical protein
MAGKPVEQLTTASVVERRRSGHATCGKLGQCLLEYGT